MQENIPTPPQAHLLAPSLSSLLRTPIQRLVIPPLYNSLDPPTEATQALSVEEAESSLPSQSDAFAAPKPARKGLVLPQGGGPFKGFAIAIVGSAEDAQRIVDEWRWDKEEVEEGERVTEVEMSDGGEDGGKALEMAKQQGLRAIK